MSAIYSQFLRENGTFEEILPPINLPPESADSLK